MRLILPISPKQSGRKRSTLRRGLTLSGREKGHSAQRFNTLRVHREACWAMYTSGYTGRHAGLCTPQDIHQGGMLGYVHLPIYHPGSMLGYVHLPIYHPGIPWWV